MRIEMDAGSPGMEELALWLPLIDFTMFQQQFYFDFKYQEGLAGLMPRHQFENMYLMIRRQPGDLIPTSDEISEIFDELGEKFTPENFKEIIRQLHQDIVVQMQGSRRIKELGESCDIMATHAELANPAIRPPSKLTDQIQTVLDNIDIAEELTLQETQIEYSCGSVLREADLTPEQQRREERRMAIAAALIEKGYGLHYFIEQQRNRGIRDIINRSKYNQLGRSVAADVFRAIQRYLQDRIEITPTSKEHLSLVLDLLLRCRTIMMPDDCLTFRRALRKAFNIPSPTVTQQEVARVYVAVQYQIKKQLERQWIKQHYGMFLAFQENQQGGVRMTGKGRSRIHRRDKKAKRQIYKGLERVWCDDLQQEFLNLFKENCDFNTIIDAMKKTFPQYRRLISSNDLKKQLHKLIRLALRRLKGLLADLKEEAPQMVVMTDKRTKYLMLVEAYEVVKELMKFYTQHYSTDLLEKTVTAINAYVNKKDTQSAKRSKEEAKTENEEEEYSDQSSNEPEEEFKRAKSVLGGMGFKSLQTRSRVVEPRCQKTTEDTWMQKMDHDQAEFSL